MTFSVAVACNSIPVSVYLFSRVNFSSNIVSGYVRLAAWSAPIPSLSRARDRIRIRQTVPFPAVPGRSRPSASSKFSHTRVPDNGFVDDFPCSGRLQVVAFEADRFAARECHVDVAHRFRRSCIRRSTPRFCTRPSALMYGFKRSGPAHAGELVFHGTRVPFVAARFARFRKLSCTRRSYISRPLFATHRPISGSFRRAAAATITAAVPRLHTRRAQSPSRSLVSLSPAC